jgi:hypothetical protein
MGAYLVKIDRASVEILMQKLNPLVPSIFFENVATRNTNVAWFKILQHPIFATFSSEVYNFCNEFLNFVHFDRGNTPPPPCNIIS